MNSALQRAHETLGSHALERAATTEHESRQGLVTRYLNALETDDVEALTALSWSDRSAVAFAS